MVSAADLLAAPLEELLAEARRLRPGPLVTYSPKVFIPLTTLCRDVCGYCTFARPPRRGERAFMTEEEVLAIARAGAAAGCREALFTLGDKPELRYKVAREELAALGCETTLEYLERCARLVLEETGLLPHLNPGVMTRAELEALRPVSASMGIMLETTAERLGAKGGPHWASPDKLPARRLETIRLAGELAIPFTSGILIGIGETREERIDALLALKALGEEHGHVQEVIVQNFRAKPGTRMASHPEPSLDDHLWTIAVARILLGPDVARAGAAEPRLRRLPAPPRRRHRRLGRRLAGDDRPRQPRGAVAGARAPRRGDALARARARAAAARSTPSTSPISSAGSIPPSRRMSAAPPTRRARARRRLGAGRAGRASRSSSGATRCRSSSSGDELGEDEITRLLEARGEEAAARLRRRRRAAARGLRRRGHATSSRGTSSTRTSATSAAASARSRRASSRRTCAARRTSSRSTRSSAARRRRGSAARPRSASRAGSTRPSPASTTRTSSARSSDGGARDPRARVLGARGLAGRRDARPLARGLPRAPPRPRARLAARERPPRSSTTRCARIICPDKVTTDQWLAVHDAAHRVGLRSNVTLMFGHVDTPRSLGAPPPARTRAAAPLGRVHRVRAAAVRADGGADLPPGTRARGPDLPRDAARPRGRAARAPPGDHEHPGLVGEARARRARARRSRPA